ncbi:hypothetical protein BGZ76_009429 [Entomortierella beljakovae]|nr:hypothetical protein BGZ76_009429 [Entomortierella beljakovae]
MYNRRRARVLDFTPVRPWPVVQRQNIEKLRSQRQEELERACVDNFDWLENYYQGCVYAAKQNKRLILRRQLESTESSLLQHQSPDKNASDITMVTTPPPTIHNNLSFSGDIQRPMINQYDYQADFHNQRALTTASPSALPRQRDQPDSSTKNNHLHYQLKSPKIPKSFSPMRSPRSPFERHRIVSRRTRVRVDATAATRKSLRAQRRRNGSGINDQRNSDIPMQLLSTQGNKSSQNNLEQLQQQLSRSHEIQPSSNNSSQPSYRSSDSNEYNISSKETLVNSDALDNSYSDTENSFQSKTPSRGSMMATSIQLRLDDDDTENLDEIMRLSTTPGSKARDSMTLISPANWSGSSKGRESNVYNTPTLNKMHGQKRAGDPLSKHNDQDMDLDIDSMLQEADYNRSRSSTFQDSIAPVRFGSPKAESSQLESLTVKARENEKKSRTQNFERAPSMDFLSKSIKNGHPQSSTPIMRKELSVEHFDSRHSSMSAGILKNTDNKSTNQGRSRSQPVGDNLSTLKSIDTPVPNLRRELSRDSLNQSAMNLIGMTKYSSDANGDQNASVKSNNLFESPVAERDRGNNASSQVERDVSNSVVKETSTGSQSSTILKNLVATTTESRSNLLAPTIKSLHSGTDNIIPRSRVATTLPERRTLGHKRPFAPFSNMQSQSGGQMPPSRLLKLTSNPTPVSLTSLSAGAATSQPQQTPTMSSTRIFKTGSAILTKDPQQFSQGTVTKPTVSSSSALNLLRQGVPRAPLPSMKATESSIARSDGQSALGRRPFLVSKTTLNFKKTTRPALPDSTLTAKSIALSGLSSSAPKSTPSSPSKKDFKREPTPVERNYEQTLDIASRVSGVANQHSTVSIHSSTAITPMQILKNSLSSMGSTSKVTSSEEMNPLAPHRSGEGDISNPFLVPTTGRSQSAAWSLSQMQSRARQERTILPDIWSDDEDEHGEPKKPSAPYPVPRWAEWEELNKSLHKQSQRNPEEIFGPLPLLDMEEIFPGREPVKKRTSSAWGVADHLTTHEISRYNKDMGWTKKD